MLKDLMFNGLFTGCMQPVYLDQADAQKAGLINGSVVAACESVYKR